MARPQTAPTSPVPCRPSRRRLPLPGLAVLAFLLALGLLLAGPAEAYKIVLKDGERIIADREYEIRGDKAIITLPNGTQATLDASEIDVEATRKANEVAFGNAIMVEGSEVRERRLDEGQRERRPTLSDMISRRERTDTSLDSRPLSQGRRRAAPGPPQTGLTRTPAGFLDLSSLPRRPYDQLEVAAELQRAFRSRGLERVELYQGTAVRRPLVEISTNSEASVFRALETSAEVLLTTRESRPGEIVALELLLTTADRERAGQFVLTPEMALELSEKRVETALFFVEHVQF